MIITDGFKMTDNSAKTLTDCVQTLRKEAQNIAVEEYNQIVAQIAVELYIDLISDARQVPALINYGKFCSYYARDPYNPKWHLYDMLSAASVLTIARNTAAAMYVTNQNISYLDFNPELNMFVSLGVAYANDKLLCRPMIWDNMFAQIFEDCKYFTEYNYDPTDINIPVEEKSQRFEDWNEIDGNGQRFKENYMTIEILNPMEDFDWRVSDFKKFVETYIMNNENMEKVAKERIRHSAGHACYWEDMDEILRVEAPILGQDVCIDDHTADVWDHVLNDKDRLVEKENLLKKTVNYKKFFQELL